MKRSELQQKADKLLAGKRVLMNDFEVDQLHEEWIACLEANMDRRDIGIETYIGYQNDANRLKRLAKRLRPRKRRQLSPTSTRTEPK